MNCNCHICRNYSPIASACYRALLACGLALAFSFAARGANVRFHFVNPDGDVADTNQFLVRAIGSNVLSSGGVVTRGVPIRVTPSADGVATNSLAVGHYSASNSYLGQGIVIRVPEDATSTVYDYTNILVSGYNTFVTIIQTNASGGGVAVNNGTGITTATNASLVTVADAYAKQLGSANLTNWSAIVTDAKLNATNPVFYGTSPRFDLNFFPDIDSSLAAGWLQLQADGKFQRTFDGSSLTNLNASELQSGTVPNARLDGDLQIIATNRIRYLIDASGTALDSVAPSQIGEWAFTDDGLLARGYGTSTGEWRKYIVVSGASALMFLLGPVEIQGDSVNITGGYLRARDSSDYHVLQSSGNNNVLYVVNTNSSGPHGTVAMQILATQAAQRSAGVVHESAIGIFGDASSYSSNAHTALWETALIAGLESGGQVGPDQHSKSNMLKSAEMIRSQTRFDQTGTSNQISHFLDETTTNLHYKIYAWETGSDSKTNRPVPIIDIDRTNFSATITGSLTVTGAVTGASFSGAGTALSALNDDNVNFDDGDGLWTATAVGAALEELNDSINSGVPNGTGAKVHWSELLGVPAGFADNTDDGGVGGETFWFTNSSYAAGSAISNAYNVTATAFKGHGSYSTFQTPSGASAVLADADEISLLNPNSVFRSIGAENRTGVYSPTPANASMTLSNAGTITFVGEMSGNGIGLTGVNAATGDSASAFFTSGTLEIARGGTGASLADPNADRILFWDDSAGAFDFLTAGSGLSISGTTITATGGGVTNFVLVGDVVQGFYAGTGAVGITIDEDNNQVTLASEDGNVQIAVANSGISMVGTVAALTATTATATTANITTANTQTNSVVQGFFGDATVTNTMTVSVLNADTLNVTNANIINYNVENLNATNFYAQTAYATNLWAQTNSAAVTPLTNIFLLGTRYTNAAQRAFISQSFYMSSPATGSAAVLLSVEQGNGITNRSIISVPSLTGLTAVGTNTLSQMIGPTARYTFSDVSGGTGTSVFVATNTASWIGL